MVPTDRNEGQAHIKHSFDLMAKTVLSDLHVRKALSHGCDSVKPGCWLDDGYRDLETAGRTAPQRSL